MFPLSSMPLKYPHGLQWPPSPDVYLAFGGNLGHRTNTDPSCSRTVDPDMALSGSQGQDLTMASSHLPVSHCLSLQCHFSPQCTNTFYCSSLLCIHDRVDEWIECISIHSCIDSCSQCLGVFLLATAAWLLGFLLMWVQCSALPQISEDFSGLELQVLVSHLGTKLGSLGRATGISPAEPPSNF